MDVSSERRPLRLLPVNLQVNSVERQQVLEHLRHRLALVRVPVAHAVGEPHEAVGVPHFPGDSEEDQADGVDVGGGGAAAAAQDLRRQPRAVLGVAGLVAGSLADGRAETEVDEVDLVFIVDGDVVLLDVIVDVAFLVELLHPAAHLVGHFEEDLVGLGLIH